MMPSSTLPTRSPSVGEKVSKKIAQQWTHPKRTSQDAPTTLDIGKTPLLLTNKQRIALFLPKTSPILAVPAQSGLQLGRESMRP